MSASPAPTAPPDQRAAALFRQLDSFVSIVVQSSVRTAGPVRPASPQASTPLSPGVAPAGPVACNSVKPEPAPAEVPCGRPSSTSARWGRACRVMGSSRSSVNQTGAFCDVCRTGGTGWPVIDRGQQVAARDGRKDAGGVPKTARCPVRRPVWPATPRQAASPGYCEPSRPAGANTNALRQGIPTRLARYVIKPSKVRSPRLHAISRYRTGTRPSPPPAEGVFFICVCHSQRAPEMPYGVGAAGCWAHGSLYVSDAMGCSHTRGNVSAAADPSAPSPWRRGPYHGVFRRGRCGSHAPQGRRLFTASIPLETAPPGDRRPAVRTVHPPSDGVYRMNLPLSAYCTISAVSAVRYAESILATG